ncbi:uncharacterized protein L201_002759 [Kwoniella dendrophila CBS 6074]|uniref:Zinc-finger domain-containing protein n=1 Tax=Kwoniella dendrophila CBS 6074 TaxID=1295534 RepID=A0AAX4JQZ2_9TREE
MSSAILQSEFSRTSLRSNNYYTPPLLTEEEEGGTSSYSHGNNYRYSSSCGSVKLGIKSKTRNRKRRIMSTRTHSDPVSTKHPHVWDLPDHNDISIHSIIQTNNDGYIDNDTTNYSEDEEDNGSVRQLSQSDLRQTLITTEFAPDLLMDTNDQGLVTTMIKTKYIPNYRRASDPTSDEPPHTPLLPPIELQKWPKGRPKPNGPRDHRELNRTGAIRSKRTRPSFYLGDEDQSQMLVSSSEPHNLYHSESSRKRSLEGYAISPSSHLRHRKSVVDGDYDNVNEQISEFRIINPDNRNGNTSYLSTSLSSRSRTSETDQSEVRSIDDRTRGSIFLGSDLSADELGARLAEYRLTSDYNKGARFVDVMGNYAPEDSTGREGVLGRRPSIVTKRHTNGNAYQKREHDSQVTCQACLDKVRNDPCSLSSSSKGWPYVSQGHFICSNCRRNPCQPNANCSICNPNETTHSRKWSKWRKPAERRAASEDITNRPNEQNLRARHDYESTGETHTQTETDSQQQHKQTPQKTKPKTTKFPSLSFDLGLKWLKTKNQNQQIYTDEDDWDSGLPPNRNGTTVISPIKAQPRPKSASTKGWKDKLSIFGST